MTLSPFPVVLAPYDEAWPEMAARCSRRLGSLGPNLLAVHHIGSTSVPGLSAKPIIDLMPVVASLRRLDEQTLQLAALGFDWHGEFGMAGRRYCTLSKNGRRVAQLHFFEVGARHIARHLAFRDYLRARPDAADAYEQEKRRARDLFPGNSHAYGDEKSAWIEAKEAEALAWFQRQESRSS
ncbi:GrpB family protein [Methylocystis bryophila]|uniref:GrpB family protein n=1 Tax=Methylocystis bryophila TaxID=655015 RepID=A0A1W6MT38_9HYPH|nr:GrpB family protein [Methylocystis bryophila]ARN80770.1 hypothetical protein B1812_06425 [Methylocystis bryophila]BDV40850.1 hypothetical protein DSM21852_41030 [Methylocystis bryophila]